MPTSVGWWRHLLTSIDGSDVKSHLSSPIRTDRRLKLLDRHGSCFISGVSRCGTHQSAVHCMSAAEPTAVLDVTPLGGGRPRTQRSNHHPQEGVWSRAISCRA